MEIAIIASILNFSVALAIVYFSFRKQATKFLVKRSDEVGAAMVEADAQCAKATAELKEWEQKWNGVGAEMSQQKEEAKARVQKHREQVLAAAKAEAERMQREALLLGGSELRKAKLALCRELSEKSVSLAQQYLRNHLKEEDRNKLVSDYVEKVTNGHSR